MGLGVLFIGYVFVALFTLTRTFFVTDLLGSFIIFSALEKLRRHAPRFKYAVAAVYVMFAVSTVQCVYYSLQYIGVTEPHKFFEQYVLEICRLSAMFALTMTLLSALSQLASLVGDEKLAGKGRRNMWFYLVSYILMLVISLDLPFLSEFNAAFSPFSFIFRIVCYILNCIFMFSCYMWICLEKDHDMTNLSAVERFIGKVTMTDRSRKKGDADGAEVLPPPEKQEPKAPAAPSRPAKKKKKKR